MTGIMASIIIRGDSLYVEFDCLKLTGLGGFPKL